MERIIENYIKMDKIMKEKETAVNEDLKSNQEKIVIEKRKIIADINKIKYPLNVTVFSHDRPWSIRNVEFWNQFKKRDDQIIEFMEKYLKEEK